MEQQLVVMGVRFGPRLDPSSSIVKALIEMYVEVGDSVALQYGGSEAHKKVEHLEQSFAGPIGAKVRGSVDLFMRCRRICVCMAHYLFFWDPHQQHKELLTSIKRYYNNSFNDSLRQDAM